MAEYNSVNLGRIMPKYTGDYSTNVNYNTLDIVFYEGSSYIATQPSLRQTPAIDSEYWGLISSKGDKGDKGDKGPKGDKGDVGPAGKDGKDAEMPVVGGRNLLRGTSEELKTITASGWGKSPTSLASGKYGAGKYYASAYIENTTPVGISLYVSLYTGGKFSHNLSTKPIPAGQSGVISFTFDVPEGQVFASAFVGFVGSQTESYTYKYKEMMITRTSTDWTPAPEDVQSDINKRAIDTSVVHNTGDEAVAGNKTYVGDNTYMGTNTFMDGLSLNGKNVVNDVTDTDWQSLSLNAGYGGSIMYRYNMGALYLGIDDLTGIQVGMDKAAGRIPNYTTSKYHRFPIIIGGKGVITGTVSPNGTIYAGNLNGITLNDSDKGYATVTVL